MLNMPNIQPGRGKKTQQVSRNTPHSGNGLAAKIAIVFKVAFFVAAVAGIVNCYIYLNQKIVETDRKIAAGNKEIHQIEREIERLRIHRETFRSWRHISRMMKAFNLTLRPPQSGQICQLTVLSVEQAAMVPFAYTPPQQATALAISPDKVQPRTITEVQPAQPRQAATVRPVRQTVQPRRQTTVRQQRQRQVRRPVVQQQVRKNTAQTRNGYPLFDAR